MEFKHKSVLLKETIDNLKVKPDGIYVDGTLGFNFEQANVPFLFTLFGNYETEAKRLIEEKLTLPAYENILKAAHTFNLLDARGALSVTERAAYIGRIRTLSRMVAQAYYESREALGFPMCGDHRKIA